MYQNHIINFTTFLTENREAHKNPAESAETA